MGAKELLALDEYVLNNFLVIFAHAPEKILKERYHARHYEQIITSDELAIIQSRLAELLAHPKVLKYDSTEISALDTMVHKVLLLLEVK